ncbi:Rha family transcriptional regulator [Campylobacter gastrosuis]|uniref:Rha family transcriptional regulator n=1 Tax=Campylobacter gastrosuis TaxID=2974576 RepID=A0ABT7HR11_9BACT|nr:Rha family transcriptional regulator [Campylobacter gastrosuis]MDL0089274.1 Rha family transcriptional regulator [Campylobacter gastrosuis]
MNEIIVINGQSVEFEVADSGVFATSLDVANVFEKRHADIIAKIAELPADSFRERNFSLTERTAKFGAVVRSEPYYKISRDGFSLLVMGFTGEKAYRWKIEFIAAFNKMEAMIKNGSIANDKFTEVLAALTQKSSEADEFKSKYYAAIERENMLLRQNFQTQGDMVKKSSRLNKSERDEIVRLYKSGLSQGEICRRMDRSRDAVRNAIRGVL